MAVGLGDNGDVLSVGSSVDSNDAATVDSDCVVLVVESDIGGIQISVTASGIALGAKIICEELEFTGVGIVVHVKVGIRVVEVPYSTSSAGISPLGVANSLNFQPEAVSAVKGVRLRI